MTDSPHQTAPGPGWISILKTTLDMFRTSPGLPWLWALETWGRRVVDREPEPETVMESAESLAAFERQAEGQGQLRAIHHFNARLASHAIAGCRRVIDLGCGPGVLLGRIAAWNPGTEFVGVDLSEGMLALANQRAGKPANVRFERGDMTRLDGFADGSVDGVISSVALHHLPDAAALARCFESVARVLRPGGAVCLVDLGRLKTTRAMAAMARTVGREAGETFIKDYETSLRAAFRREEMAPGVERHLPKARLWSAAGFPVTHVVATALKPLDEGAERFRRADNSTLNEKSRAALAVIEGLMARGGLTLPEA